MESDIAVGGVVDLSVDAWGNVGKGMVATDIGKLPRNNGSPLNRGDLLLGFINEWSIETRGLCEYASLTSFPTPSPPGDPRSWGARADAEVDAGGEDAGSPPKHPSMVPAPATAPLPFLKSTSPPLAPLVAPVSTPVPVPNEVQRVPHEAYDAEDFRVDSDGDSSVAAAAGEAGMPEGLKGVEAMIWQSDRHYAPLRVRDFAFEPSDPLHYGLPRHLFPHYLDPPSDTDGAGASDAQDADVDGSDSDGDGDGNDYSGLKRYDESSTSIVSQFSTASASGGRKLTGTVRCDAAALVANFDLAKALSGKFELHGWRFKKARAMYEFRREGEVEMDLDEGEELTVVGVEETLGEEEEEESDVKDPPTGGSQPVSTITPASINGDRTASIDSPSTSAPTVTFASPSPPRTSVYVRPRTAGQTLDRLLGVAIRTYPPGWILAVKTRVKVKGKVARIGEEEGQGLRTVRVDKDGRVRIRCKVVEAGLVPRNYVQVDGEENETWEGEDGEHGESSTSNAPEQSEMEEDNSSRGLSLMEGDNTGASTAVDVTEASAISASVPAAQDIVMQHS
ncbi:hypothetical protein HDU93_003040 [Gonapodya sp. JEL0774]|nr:hypothetical protein HDU93_003040 [Gonapodya sp. JEL0774]